jgi:ABC-type Mn2+/Zn2+ transport system permease subunit
MIDWIAEPLNHETTVRALVEISILGAVSGAVGCWVVLYEISYSAESLAHGMFPGLVGAALLGLPLLLGGAVGIILAALLIAVFSRFGGDAADTAIAVVVSTLFGLGVLMALSPESPPGIQSLLFGDLLGIGDGQLAATAAIAFVVLGILWLFHDRLLAIGFNRDAGPSLGLRPGIITALLLSLVAITVLVGVQGLGNLLVAAILVGPAATARLVSRRVGPMMLTAVLVALIAGVAGIYASYYLRTAAGASVVVALLACYLLAAGATAMPVRPRVEGVRIGS